MHIVIGIGATALEDFDSFTRAREEIAAADVVLGLDSGEIRDLKGDALVTTYVLEGAENVLMECCAQIKAAWEETVDPEKNHLGHYAAGMWLFYWPGPDLRLTRELVNQGRCDDLRKSARAFIASGFGAQTELATADA